ncbi:hypothetical protein [Sphingomonas sp.]|uniref:hypothetical protein n=1 Tax=Sphingomonas sp. TaxID=28214 RepID=UPI003BA93BED
MSILAEIEAFLAETGMAASRFGALSVNDNGLMSRARAGREITPARAEKIRAFMVEQRDSPAEQVKRGPKPTGGTCVDCGVKCFRRSLRCRPCSAAARSGIARNKEDREKPLPSDFAEAAATRRVLDLRKHYGVGERTIRRWLAEAGIVRTRACRFGGREMPARDTKPVEQQAIAPKRATPRSVWRQPGPRPLPDARDNSRAGMAAQYLQKFGPVFRCNAEGRLDPRGTHWNRGGRTVLTDDEIMERARSKGWDPDAWMEIAA